MKPWQKIIVCTAPLWIIPVMYAFLALTKYLERLAL